MKALFVVIVAVCLGFIVAIEATAFWGRVTGLPTKCPVCGRGDKLVGFKNSKRIACAHCDPSLIQGD